MLRSTTTFATAILLSVGFATAQAPVDAAQFAHSYVELNAPSYDDPDKHALACLQATERHRSASYSEHLVQLVQNQRRLLQRPGELLPTIEKLLGHDDLHGETRDRLRWLRHQLLLADGKPQQAARHEPMQGMPKNYLLVGPFGEGEDCFAGVAYAPELSPWTQTTQFETPTRKLRVRPFTIDIGASHVTTADPARPGDGCYYALHRVRADAATQCFLRLWCRGGLEVFVNGVLVSSTDPALEDNRNTRSVPIALAAGVNHVLVKTTRNRSSDFELSYLDGRGNVIDTLTEVPNDEPVGEHASPIPAERPALVSGVDLLRKSIGNSQGDDQTALRIATGLIAESIGMRELQLSMLDELQTDDARQQLAAARLWRRLDLVPEEIRNSRARALEEAAQAQVQTYDWAMLRAQIGLLQEQDKREQALHELWSAIDAGHTGPATFRLLLEVARGARFTQERKRILHRWHEELPNDPTPMIEMSRDCWRAGAMTRAAELGMAAMRLRPDLQENLRHAYRPLVDLGNLDAARELIAMAMPQQMYLPSKRFTPMLWDAAVAHRDADQSTWLELTMKVLAHASADADDCRNAADALLARGHRDLAEGGYLAVLERDPDDMQARRSLHRLRGQPEPGADFARFHRNGDAAIEAFSAGEREASAPATTLIDQRIVEVFDDGSMLVERHELRRLNDPRGVDQYSDPSAPSEADQVMLLRTIDRAGEVFVPVRVQDNYSMPRLEPGAFVEWRYQDFYGANPLGISYVPDFPFRSANDHKLVSELIVIRSKNSRLELRQRNLDAEPERIDLGDGREALRYVVKDSLRLTPERSMPALGDLVPIVAGGKDGSAMATLRANAHRLASISRPTPPIRRQVQQLLGGFDVGEEQLRRLHTFCHEQIATARSRSATETLMRKRGDRQSLLLAMLRTAGFQLESALCESIRADFIQGDGALFHDPERHYDMWCVRISRADMQPQWLFFDTPRYYPPGAIPPKRGAAGALVLTANGLEQTCLPTSDEHMQSMRITAAGTLTADSLVVEAELTLGGDNGYAAAAHFLQQPRNAQKQFARRYAQQMFAGWQVQSADIGTLEKGKQVAVKATLRRRSLQSDGDRELLSMPVPPGGFLGAFGARPGREIAMRITQDLHLSWDLRLKLDGVQVRSIPEATTVAFDGLSYLQQIRLDGDTLVFRRRATMTPMTLPTTRFGDWMQTLQQVERAENLSLEFGVARD